MLALGMKPAEGIIYITTQTWSLQEACTVSSMVDVTCAMQTLLTEMARIRAHGFSEREITIARSKLMADIESGSSAFQYMGC
jgi:hypothetical protein